MPLKQSFINGVSFDHYHFIEVYCRDKQIYVNILKGILAPEQINIKKWYIIMRKIDFLQ